jgi:hypothetical protein
VVVEIFKNVSDLQINVIENRGLGEDEDGLSDG